VSIKRLFQQQLNLASLRNWNGGILEQWVLGRWYVGLLAKFILPWGQELINIYFPFKTDELVKSKTHLTI
jgi:hypothetical protein